MVEIPCVTFLRIVLNPLMPIGRIDLNMTECNGIRLDWIGFILKSSNQIFRNNLTFFTHMDHVRSSHTDLNNLRSWSKPKDFY